MLMAMSQRMWMREQERRKRERERRARRRRNCAIAVFVLAIIAVICIVFAMNGNKNKPKETNAPIETVEVPEGEIDKSTAYNAYTTTRKADDIKLSFYNGSVFAGNALAETIGMYGILPDAYFYSNVNANLDNVYTVTTAGSTASIVEQFKSKNFKKIFLAFGENELKDGNSADFKSDYRALIQKIKEYQPNVSIYLIAIPPVTAEMSEANTNGITMSRIRSYNKQIKTLAVEEDIYYIDSIDALGDNKDFLPSGVSVDGVNLNKAAVIDLLYYVAKEAYIPTRADLEADAEREDEEEIEPDSTPSPVSDEEGNEPDPPAKPENNGDEPSPTVNVLKTSEIKKTKKE